MDTKDQDITITRLQTITLPAGIAGGLTAPYFLDALPLPGATPYTAAALVGNINGQGNVLGVLAWSVFLNYAQAAPASIGTYTAVCGAAGGFVALGKTDGGIHIELRNSPLIDPEWNVVGKITFNGVTGTIQAMAQRDGTIYGFIKGQQNAFFTVASQDQATPTIVYYTGEAAAAPFPFASSGSYVGLPHSVAFHNQRMYAIGESHANALYASLAGYGVVSLPIPKSDTWSIHVNDPQYQAYGVYGATEGNVMPYSIQDDGSLDGTGFTTISGNAGDSLAIDTNLQLVYLASGFMGLRVIDARTNQLVKPKSMDSSLNFMAPGGAWADNDNRLLLVSGMSNSTSQIGVYRVST